MFEGTFSDAMVVSIRLENMLVVLGSFFMSFLIWLLSIVTTVIWVCLQVSQACHISWKVGIAVLYMSARLSSAGPLLGIQGTSSSFLWGMWKSFHKQHWFKIILEMTEPSRTSK